MLPARKITLLRLTLPSLSEMWPRLSHNSFYFQHCPFSFFATDISKVSGVFFRLGRVSGTTFSRLRPGDSHRSSEIVKILSFIMKIRFEPFWDGKWRYSGHMHVSCMGLSRFSLGLTSFVPWEREFWAWIEKTYIEIHVRFMSIASR